MSAVRRVGPKEELGNPSALPRSSGVRDGRKLTTGIHIQCNAESLTWRHLWKYCLSPWRYRRAVQSTTTCHFRGCLSVDDCDQCDFENLHSALSRRRMDDSDLVRMMGQHQQLRDRHELGNYNISWVHRHAWPYAVPRYQKEHALLDRIEIAPQLFYLGGAEDILSSMEMSCRIGRNAAGMLYRQGT